MSNTLAEIEAVSEATQTAELLASSIRQAHRTACGSNALLAHVLEGHLATAAKLHADLAYLEIVMRPELVENPQTDMPLPDPPATPAHSVKR